MLDNLGRDKLLRRTRAVKKMDMPEAYRRHPFEYIDSLGMLWRIMFRYDQGTLFRTYVDDDSATDTATWKGAENLARLQNARAAFIASFGGPAGHRGRRTERQEREELRTWDGGGEAEAGTHDCQGIGVLVRAPRRVERDLRPKQASGLSS